MERSHRRREVTAAGSWSSRPCRSSRAPACLPRDAARRVEGERAAVSASPEEAVLLLHGAWMNRWVMSYLALALRREGFAVQTLSYRTMRGTLAEHLARVAEKIAALEAPRLHLVGHSLGGVIVLRYLQRRADPRVRRAVLLGSPVAGCRAAADLAQSAGGELLLGASLGVWREPVDVSVDPRFEVGAIAGTFAFGLGRMVTRLPKPNDGVVCLDETKFPALRDHLALPLGHTLMLASPRIARQTAAFLRTGAFRR
ncbi:MAG: alpha/beta fold hydrolase [Betaproteobacteria bacterium]|nr:MAG: alpha/beta fold hydrolase [Betaproteobacteria bacterium]